MKMNKTTFILLFECLFVCFLFSLLIYLFNIYFLVDECQNYQTLSDAERKETYSSVWPYQCDDNLNDWYRFEGAAGTHMATTCPLENRCDASWAGWLNGAHPAVAEGTVIRKVCFRFKVYCCRKSIFIQVKNCGSYYIYNLRGTPGCNMRYCGGSD